METLVVHPRSKEQMTALKAIMKALKVDFTTEKGTDGPYNAEFVDKINQSEEDITTGRITKIESAEIWTF